MNGRRAFRWLAVAAGAALLALLLAVAWLLATDSGRNWALARLQASLAPGATLRIEAVRGALAGPIELRGVHYRDAHWQVDIAHLRLDHALTTLWRGHWTVRQLRLEQVRVQQAPTPATTLLPSWPGVLPRWSLPLTVDIRALHVRDLQWRHGPAAPWQVTQLDSAFALGDGALTIASLRARAPAADLSLRGSYQPRNRYRSDLTLRANWRVGAAPVPVSARLQGDLRAAQFTLDAGGAAPLMLRASLRQGDGDTPDWRVDARTPGLSTAALGIATAHVLDGQFTLTGRGGAVHVEGRGHIDARAVAIAPSTLRLAPRTVRLDALALHLAEGTVTLGGRIDAHPAGPRFDLRARSDSWRLPAHTSSGTDVVASGELRLQGAAASWQADGNARLQRGPARATVALRAHGDDAAMEVTQLNATSAAGRLQATGRVGWRPQVQLQARVEADAFNPAFFLPDYPGALAGTLRVDATRDATHGWIGEAALEALRGRWRGRPVRGQAQARWDGSQGDGTLALVIGRSHVAAQAHAGRTFDATLRVDPLDLGDVIAGAEGVVRGELGVGGRREAPVYRSNLHGTGMAWNGLRAARLALTGTLPTGGARARSELALDTLTVHGQALGDLALDIDGTLGDWHAALGLTGAAGRVQAALQARRAASGWQGQLEQLRVAPIEATPWTLRAPTPVQWSPTTGTRAAACVIGAAPGAEVCARYDGRTADLQLRALPLALLQPWLDRQSRGVVAGGAIDGQARFAAGARGWDGQARISAAQLTLQLRDTAAPRALLDVRQAVATLALGAGQLQAHVEAQLPAGGRVQGDANAALGANATLAGRVDVDLRDLAWLELFSIDLAQPRGTLRGTLALGGTLGAPRWRGQLQLADFAAELPALNVPLRAGAAELSADESGRVDVHGEVQAGGGRLRVTGDYVPGRAPAPLQLALDGQNVRAADTPDLQAELDPDLQVAVGQGTLRLRGSVRVVRANVNLERLDNGVSASPDVVVLDPAPGASTPGLVVDSDVEVTLGDDVRLRGFGLDGRLGGGLRVRDRPGRAATATGSLLVRGSYRAYGRKLEIVRGRLDYSGDRFDDPSLDLLAQREIEDVTVGVRVRGRALAPETTVVSTPAMETTEALSWLVFGRPLASTTGDESRALGASALALSAGSNLLAQQVGAHLGLDEAGVVDSRALGGAALTVGKRISPRLFVSYGVSLLGTGQVVTLKYLLRRGLDATLESGTETAAALRWHKDK